MTFQCVVCRKSITVSYFVCAGCNTEYGGSYRQYPEWLRDLVRMERRERYRAQRDDEREVPLGDHNEPTYVEPWDADRFPLHSVDRE